MKTPFFHIVNPNAKNKKSVADYLARQAHLMHRWVRRESHPTHLETLIEWAYEEGYRDLAIWGGDGSFSRAIQYLKERNWLSEVRLALVPVGTCNDFARYLKIKDWRRLVDSLKRPARNFVLHDVGIVKVRDQERIFINNAGFGRSSSGVTAARSHPIKDIFDLSAKSMSIEWDSHTHHEFQTMSALFMIIFNAPYFSNGLHFSSDISSIDGQLNAVLVPDRSRWNLLWRFVRGRLGKSLMDSQMIQFEAEAVHVELQEPVYIQTDGDLAFPCAEKKFSFGLQKKKIQILTQSN